MTTALVVLLVGALLCFYGIRSVNLALIAAGFAIGFFLADAFDADAWTTLWIALGTALVVWMIVSLIFRFATFVVGLATGAVIGAKVWASLNDSETSILLGIFVIATTAFASGMLAEKYTRRALLWLTALGGASIILSGAALLWPEAFDFLAHPDEGWQQTVMMVVWLAIGGTGWYVQRQLFRERLGLPPKEPKPAPTPAAPAPTATAPAPTAPATAQAPAPAPTASAGVPPTPPPAAAPGAPGGPATPGPTA
ncbi:DUF4203 domain-containing protein [Cellulomonas sp. DKR-3]|uniref:DUF4203 domain-containing protein n=1 Tax=Cellulomonas fulva TaxID=2835530 RepID=A0ABS5TVT0_9CELL|nr:DUF4203 domain-containing protein [Cellulomonas fulva]MBT0993241.1 DUF4203 domain-containing protein [Cellulomonas fulva]